MRYYDFYPEYVSVASKRAKAEKKLKELKKKDPSIRPVLIQGRTIARTWWGKAWNINLESYADYSNRIGRGRSYVQNGMVLDLKIEPGQVRAIVQGTASSPYSVTVKIDVISQKVWKNIRNLCQGRLDSLQELLQGKFPKDLGEIFTARGKGLFPSPKEIDFSCSCPDWASMCKHVAATLYGIGARLDDDPLLFFKLRDANVKELISEVVVEKTRELLGKAKKKAGRIIDEADIGKVFGIELEDQVEPTVIPVIKKIKAKSKKHVPLKISSTEKIKDKAKKDIKAVKRSIKKKEPPKKIVPLKTRRSNSDKKKQ